MEEALHREMERTYSALSITTEKEYSILQTYDQVRYTVIYSTFSTNTDNID
ncbi:hypothetical protein Scep_022296 [Stephania cephalantha]|uniref:Uncharacterized protein n=1 Tax=Stephania cephalantha TaxID=152367 RepID=A0AAP0FAP3_9MAGN